MSLYHSYSSANKVTTSALSITYTALKGEASELYEYHRLASKQYEFVGMDRITAEMCAANKTAQYLRDFVLVRDSSGDKPDSPQVETKSVATVTAEHEDGDMWKVVISVNEDQVQYPYKSELSECKTDWFVTDLDYDEDGIVGSYAEMLTSDLVGSYGVFTYEIKDNDFPDWPAIVTTPPTGLHFQSAETADGPFTDDATVLAYQYGVFRVAVANLKNYYRIVWQNTPSNAIASAATTHALTGTLAIPLISTAGYRAGYSFDVPNYNYKQASVWVKGKGETTFSDVTEKCDLRSSMVYFTFMQTYEGGCFKAKIYDGVHGIYTNEAMSDGYTGEVEIVGAGNYPAEVDKDNCIQFRGTETGFDPTDVDVIYSTDSAGTTWQTLENTTLDTTGTNPFILWSNQSALANAKFFALMYNGLRASDKISETPFPHASGATHYVTGIYCDGEISVDVHSTTGTEPTGFTFETSSDEGSTWTAVAFGSFTPTVAGSTDEYSAVSDAEYSLASKTLFRVLIDGTEVTRTYLPMT